MKFASMALILTLLITQTGCWNAREINELAFVLSIALDKADNGFRVTAQIAKPETYSKTTTGGATTTEKEKPFWVISSTGETIFEAVRNMATVSPRRIFWSHIKVIILGEELAKDSVLEILDFFSRNPELRLRTWVAVTEGEAGKILEIVPMMEKDPSLNIEKIIEKTNLTGKAYGIMLKNFLEEYLDPYIDPVAARIVVSTTDDKPAVKVEGASVFSENKLQGWLNENETRGLLWVKNKIKSSLVVVKCPYDGLPVTLEIKKGRTSIKSNITNGVPQFIINASATVKLTEKACLTEYNRPETLQALAKVLEAEIKDDIQASVNASKKFKSDFLNLNRTLERTHNKEWHQISDRVLIVERAQVDIQVKVKIPEISLLAKPLIPKQ